MALLLSLTGALLVRTAPADAAPLAYPQNQCSTLSLNATNFSAGETVRVTGAFFEPTARVTIVLRASDGTVLARKTVTSDSTGRLSVQFTAPSVAGSYVIVATSGFTRAGQCPDDPDSAFQVLADGANNGGTHGTGGEGAGPAGNGGTAFTGLDIAALIAIAVALLVGGGLLTARGRRRTAR